MDVRFFKLKCIWGEAVESVATALNYTTVSESDSDKVSVIVVCGGSSSRMGGIDKMMTEVKGVPVCVRSVLAFQNCEKVSGIIIVTKAESVLKMQQLCGTFKLTKVTDIVEGGSCRQQSVANGLAQIPDDSGVVLIHDGARPFVTEDCIERVIDGVKQFSAVTCAVPLKDTVKSVRSDGLVTATPDRSTLQSVQTPQGFSVSLYKKAVEENAERLDSFTDDCSVVESIGYPVYTVMGDYKNIKITTAEDLQIAEVYAKELP